MSFYSGVLLFQFNNSYAQIIDMTVNGTVTSPDNSVIISPINETQSSKIKPCLDLMNPGMVTMNSYDNIKGSLKLNTNIGNLFSHIHTSLVQAITTAERAVGNNSMAVEAYLCNANGYLVYMIWVIDKDTFDTIDAIVDPMDNQILLKNSNILK